MHELVIKANLKNWQGDTQNLIFHFPLKIPSWKTEAVMV